MSLILTKIESFSELWAKPITTFQGGRLTEHVLGDRMFRIFSATVPPTTHREVGLKRAAATKGRGGPFNSFIEALKSKLPVALMSQDGQKSRDRQPYRPAARTRTRIMCTVRYGVRYGEVQYGTVYGTGGSQNTGRTRTRIFYRGDPLVTKI